MRRWVWGCSRTHPQAVTWNASAACSGCRWHKQILGTVPSTQLVPLQRDWFAAYEAHACADFGLESVA